MNSPNNDDAAWEAMKEKTLSDLDKKEADLLKEIHSPERKAERKRLDERLMVFGKPVEKRFQKAILSNFKIVLEDQKTDRELETLREFLHTYHHIGFCPDMQVYFAWNGTHFEKWNEFHLRRFCDKYLVDDIGDKNKTQFVKMVRDHFHVRGTDFLMRDMEAVNFKNGIFCLKTKRLVPHSPDYRFAYCLPVSYVDRPVTKVWDKLLSAICMDRLTLVQAIEEFVGYALSGCSYHQFNKSLFLDGEGSNGKSTLLEVIRLLFSNELVTSTSLMDIRFDKHAMSDFEGKLLAISAEMPPEAFGSTSAFKQLTGNDMISANPKNAQRYQFKNYAKFIVTYNEMPRFQDQTSGFLRRPIVIPCEQNFDKNRSARVEDPIRRIVSGGELDSIASKCLRAFLTTMKRGDFVFVPESEQRLLQIKRESNLVQTFFDDYLEFSPEVDHRLPLDKLFEEFNMTYFGGEKHKWIAKEVFATRLYKCVREAGEKVGVQWPKNFKFYKRMKTNGLRYRVVLCVRLNQKDEDEELSAENLADKNLELSRKIQ